MLSLSNSVRALALVSFAALSVTPAAAAMRVAQGQAYWSGDPGPVDPGVYWNSGQFLSDPHHYMSWYGGDPQDYKMTVYAPHSGATRCVWRARVTNSYWELAHPYIRVCR